MARYSIEDTTLTALGDAIRSVVGETREEQVPLEQENPIHFYIDTEEYDVTSLPLSPGMHYELNQDINIPGATTYKVISSYDNSKGDNGGSSGGILKYTSSTGTATAYGCNLFTNAENTVDAPYGIKISISIYKSFYEMGKYFTLDFSIYAYDSDGNLITTQPATVPNTLTPLQMAEVINNLLPAPSESALVISGDCEYKFSGGGWDWFINLYGNKITTKDIGTLSYCFNGSLVKEIPFELNMNPSNSTSNLTWAFANCSELEAAPKINKLKVSKIDNSFTGCKKLKSFPEGFAEDWNWTSSSSSTSGYSYNCNKMFGDCYNLRSIPAALLGQNKYNPAVNYSYAFYYQGFNNCYSLEELTNVPVHNKATWTSAAMSYFVTNCYRLKKLTFATQEDGTPYVVKWKSQTLDLTKTGFCPNGSGPTFKSATGFTDDTKIATPEDWHGYINGTNPDAWAYNTNHSAFGKTAATELINSLPDASAYLASSSGTNTLKMQGMAAFEIPGEDMRELPEEVIAAAAAKGWTVSLI